MDPQLYRKLYRAAQVIPRIQGLPGDYVFVDPHHPSMLTLVRLLPNRDWPALMSYQDEGLLIEVTLPSSDFPSRASRRWRPRGTPRGLSLLPVFPAPEGERRPVE